MQIELLVLFYQMWQRRQKWREKKDT